MSRIFEIVRIKIIEVFSKGMLEFFFDFLIPPILLRGPYIDSLGIRELFRDEKKLENRVLGSIKKN